MENDKKGHHYNLRQKWRLMIKCHSGEPRGLVATRGPTWEKEIRKQPARKFTQVKIEGLNNQAKPNLQKGKAMNFDNDNKERNTINAFL